MQSVFKSELDSVEIDIIRKFCNLSDYFSLEQSIGFSDILYRTRIRYFYLIEDNIIKCFSQINENFRFAQIRFGPVCCDKDVMVYSINEIINYYKKKNFCYLGIQMYYKAGYDTDFIEYSLNKSHRIKYIFNNENTKSSLEIDLGKGIEEIYSHIRKGHKSDIKRAIRSGLKVEGCEDKADLNFFIDVYLRMCKARGYSGHSPKEISGICEYLTSNKQGQILLVKDINNIVLGGIILAYQGVSVRYILGASDPDRHELPLLHLVIYKAIEILKTDSFKYFDFWGYNHFAVEKDQVYNINNFKKGFGGYFTFLAKKMNISLIPGGYRIYRLSESLKVLKGNLHIFDRK